MWSRLSLVPFRLWVIGSPPSRRERCRRRRALETLARWSEWRYSRVGGFARCIPLARGRGPAAGGTRTGPASLTSFRSPRSCVRSSPIRDVRSLRNLPVLNRACRVWRDVYQKHIPYFVNYPPRSHHQLSGLRSVKFHLIIKFLFWTFHSELKDRRKYLRLNTWLVGIVDFCRSVQIKDCLDCGKGKSSV